MEKNFLLILMLILLLSGYSYSQSYLGYYFIPTDFNQYEEFTGGTVSTATGIDGFENISLPFPFEYMGQTYTTARISVNGWLEMGQSYTGSGYLNELESTVKKPLICPLWDDLYADSQTEIRYGIIGEYPARIFIVQWKDITWDDYFYIRKSFQVRLWEIDNTIDFVYGPWNTYTGYISYSVGMNNETGGTGNFISVTPSPDYNHTVDTVIANNNILDLSLVDENLMYSFVPDIYSFENKLAVIYQTPGNINAGVPDQEVAAIIMPCHEGDVLTNSWVTKFYFNTYGTTNTGDITNGKLYFTGSSPYFSSANQLGNTVPDPGSLFSIGGFYQGLINNKSCYFWLAYDISANAVNGNHIDGNCYLIERYQCCPSVIPDSTLATAYKIITGGTPVELVSFSAETDGRAVVLNWETATEENNRGFEVQRLQNYKIAKLQNWERIGFVKGNGTTTITHSYSYTDKNVSPGKYYYRLKQIDFDGSFEYSKVVEVNITASTKFSLKQNYPNPFNPVTTIKYSIPNVGTSFMKFVQLKVYNTLGEEVETLVNEEKPAGSYTVKFDASNLPSGVYIYRLTAGNYSAVKKLVLLK
jgi:hypothetical protein